MPVSQAHRRGSGYAGVHHSLRRKHEAKVFVIVLYQSLNSLLKDFFRKKPSVFY